LNVWLLFEERLTTFAFGLKEIFEVSIFCAKTDEPIKTTMQIVHSKLHENAIFGFEIILYSWQKYK
jgi:hypothetical protein